MLTPYFRVSAFAIASSMLPQDERTPQELAFSKAHDIQYAEVDPHSGEELDNDYDV